MNADLKVTDRSERELAEASFNERISGGIKWRTPLLKWIVPAVLAIVLCADLVVNSAHADNTAAKPAALPPEKIATPVTPAAPMTTFVDGPTGFVFVYTAEGWKFVRSSGAN